MYIAHFCLHYLHISIIKHSTRSSTIFGQEKKNKIVGNIKDYSSLATDLKMEKFQIYSIQRRRNLTLHKISLFCQHISYIRNIKHKYSFASFMMQYFPCSKMSFQ